MAVAKNSELISRLPPPTRNSSLTYFGLKAKQSEFRIKRLASRHETNWKFETLGKKISCNQVVAVLG